MKIALLTHEYPPYPGGIGRYCEEVAAAAQAMGHQVHVFAPNHNSAPTHNQTTPGVVAVSRFSGDVFRFHSIVSLVASVRKLLSPQEYDIIHIADWPMLLAYNLAFPFCKVPLTVTLHGTDVFTLAQSTKARALLSRRAFGRVTRVCANSAYTLGLAKKQLGLTSGMTSAVTHLAANEYWCASPTADEETAFDAFVKNSGNADHILTTVARIDSRKGHRNAILAIAKMSPDVKKRTLYIAIGKIVDAPLHTDLLALAKEQGVNIVFTGRQSDAFIRTCYKRSSAFLLLAEPEEKKIEGFGLVFLEAASQGLYSIASNVHAIPEVVQAGITGALLDPHDHSAIANSIMSHLSRPRDERAQAQIIAHARSFSWEACAARTYSQD